MKPEEILASSERASLPAIKFLATYYPEAHVRREYLKQLGVVFADDSSFANVGFTVTPNSPDDAHVYIGKNVSIAPNVTCICHSCANNGEEINQHKYVADKLTKKANIHIDDEAWIGANVTILPGVTVGKCAVIGAGCALVTDADPYGIYAGVPGKKIGDIRQWDESLS